MPTFDELYRPAALKIERAKHHVNDLNARINEYLSNKPFELFIVEDVHAGQRTHEVETKQPIPDGLSLVLGDAVHNLRSALDVTIFGMVGANATKPWLVQFPFTRNQKGLHDAIVKAEISLAHKNVIAVIEAAQPYGGGDVLLYGLNTLDITDKHRLIIATSRIAEVVASDLVKMDPGLSHIVGEGKLRFAGNDGTVLTVNFPRPSRRDRRANKGYTPTRHKPDFQPAFDIAFGGSEAFAGQPVVPKLIEIAASVEALCRDLCVAFLKP